MKLRFSKMASKRALGWVCSLALSGLVLLSSSLPASAYTSELVRINESGGSPSYRIALNTTVSSSSSLNRGWNWRTLNSGQESTDHILRFNIFNYNGGISFTNPSIFEVIFETDNMIIDSMSAGDGTSRPLGCDAQKSEEGYSKYHCYVYNTDSAASSAGHYLYMQLTVNLANSSNRTFGIFPSNWIQYQIPKNVDYTDLLTAIKNNTSSTNTKLDTIIGYVDGLEGKLDSIKTDSSNISSKTNKISNDIDVLRDDLYHVRHDGLNALNNLNTSVNQSIAQEKATTDELKEQNEKDDQDRQDAEAQVEESETKAEESKTKLEGATSSLTDTMSDFVATFNTPAGNCTIRVNTGTLDLGNVDLCSIPDEMHDLISTVMNLIGVFISLALTINMFELITDIIAQYTGVGFGYERALRAGNAYTLGGLISQWSTSHYFDDGDV